jgi:hypothetical protein
MLFSIYYNSGRWTNSRVPGHCKNKDSLNCVTGLQNRNFHKRIFCNLKRRCHSKLPNILLKSVTPLSPADIRRLADIKLFLYLERKTFLFLLDTLLAHSTLLKIEAVGSSETSLDLHWTIWSYKTWGSALHSQRPESLKLSTGRWSPQLMHRAVMPYEGRFRRHQ